MKRLMMLMITLILVVAPGYSQTFKTYTGGTQVSTETWDLTVPQQVLNPDTVGAEQLIDGSVGTAAVAVGYNLLTDAEKTQALTGSSTVDFVAKTVTQTPGTGLIKMVNVTLANGATSDVKTLFGLTANPHGIVEVTTVGFAGHVRVRVNGATNSSILLEGSTTQGSETDTAVRVCVFSAGSSQYTIKNNLGAERTFICYYKGVE